MKILLYSLGGVAALLVLTGVALYLFGRTLPEQHNASITFTVPKARALVWTALTDYAAMPQWWPAVKAVRFETTAAGAVLTWNKDVHGKEIAFRTREEAPPGRLVREIVGPDLPFGGTWTYELVADRAATRIKLTEDGFIKPPLFRAIARLFLKPDATMRDFEQHFTAHLAAK